MQFRKLICQLTFECVSLYHGEGPGKNAWACGGGGTVNPLRVWFPLPCGVLCGWWEQIGHHKKPGSFSLWKIGPLAAAVRRGGSFACPGYDSASWVRLQGWVLWGCASPPLPDTCCIVSHLSTGPLEPGSLLGEPSHPSKKGKW